MTIAIFTPNPLNCLTTNDGTVIEAVTNGNLDAIKTLMEQQAGLHIDYGCVLIAAAGNNQLEIVKYLVEFKANFLAEKKHNGLPIYEDLVNWGDNTDADDALIYAATKGQFDVVKYLIEQRADVHARGDLAVVRASIGGHLEIVRYLVEEGGANLHTINSVMSLPHAALRGHFEVVKYLLEQGANLNAQGGLALRWAVRYNHYEIVEYLLEQEGSPIEVKGGMKLLTRPQRQQLLKNFWVNDAIIQKDGNRIDFKPVVKLVTSDANCIWLLTELSPDGMGFGLCDRGYGFPEIGYASLVEFEAIREKLGLSIETDKKFIADKTLSQYAKLATRAERIIT